MTHSGNTDPFAQYLEALNRCCEATKLTAFHTRECARQCDRTADMVLLTVYHVKEVLYER